jgi:hypothetical protein
MDGAEANKASQLVRAIGVLVGYCRWSSDQSPMTAHEVECEIYAD